MHFDRLRADMYVHNLSCSCTPKIVVRTRLHHSGVLNFLKRHFADEGTLKKTLVKNQKTKITQRCRDDAEKCVSVCERDREISTTRAGDKSI